MLDCKEPGKDAGSGKEIITLVYNKQANDSDILQALDSFKSLICNRVEILPLKRYHYLKAWYEMLTGPYSFPISFCQYSAFYPKGEPENTSSVTH